MHPATSAPPDCIPGTSSAALLPTLPSQNVGQWAANNLRMVKAYDVMSGKSRIIPGLPQPLRQQLMGEESTASINRDLRKSWQITEYFCMGKNIHDARRFQDYFETCEKEKETIISEDGTGECEIYLDTPMEERIIEIAFVDPVPAKTEGTLQVKLPSIETGQMAKRKYLGLVFDRRVTAEESSSNVPNRAFLVKPEIPPVVLTPYSARRTTPIVGEVRLKAQEKAIFRRDGDHWQTVCKVVALGENLVPNPLLRESGPCVVDTKRKLKSYPNDGEYFLNEEMLTRLYQDKQDRQQQKQTQPCLPWSYERSDRKHSRLEELARNHPSYHFFFERINSAHTVAVYVRHTSLGLVQCYIHETEGSENATAINLRYEIISRLKAHYPDNPIFCVYPYHVLQRDFAGCGVFAYKGMSHFSNRPAEMNRFLDLCSPKATLQPDQVDTYAVPFQEIPPRLLKVYDGLSKPASDRQPRFKDSQLQAKVSKKAESLEEYLQQHERSVMSEDGSHNITINTRSFSKRYELFDRFEQLQRKDNELQKLMPGQREPIPKLVLKRLSDQQGESAPGAKKPAVWTVVNPELVESQEPPSSHAENIEERAPSDRGTKSIKS